MNAKCVWMCARVIVPMKLNNAFYLMVRCHRNRHENCTFIRSCSHSMDWFCFLFVWMQFDEAANCDCFFSVWVALMNYSNHNVNDWKCGQPIKSAWMQIANTPNRNLPHVINWFVRSEGSVMPSRDIAFALFAKNPPSQTSKTPTITPPISNCHICQVLLVALVLFAKNIKQFAIIKRCLLNGMGMKKGENHVFCFHFKNFFFYFYFIILHRFCTLYLFFIWFFSSIFWFLNITNLMWIFAKWPITLIGVLQNVCQWNKTIKSYYPSSVHCFGRRTIDSFTLQFF